MSFDPRSGGQHETFGPSFRDPFSPPPPPRSGTSWLWLLGCGGLMFLLCCGGGIGVMAIGFCRSRCHGRPHDLAVTRARLKNRATEGFKGQGQVALRTKMTVERFKQANTTPFRPFTIFVADETTIPVVSREFVSLSPSGRTVVVFDPQDRMNILDLLLATNLQVEPANGSRQRKKK